MAQQLRANRQDRIRRAASELLRMLGHMTGPDEPATRDIAAAIEERREAWPG